MQQRLEDLRVACRESHNIETVQRHVDGVLEVAALAYDVARDAMQHERNLRKATTRLPLGID